MACFVGVVPVQRDSCGMNESQKDGQPTDEVDPEQDKSEEESLSAEESSSEDGNAANFFDAQAEADAHWTRPLDVRRFIRGLLIGAIVLVFLGAGWFVMQRQKLALQIRLTEQLERLGGTVHYDTDFDDQGQLLPKDQRSTGFLAAALGEDLFRRVEGITLANGFDREAFKMLPQFQELHMLSCRDTAVTDGDLARITDAIQLQSIDLAGTQVTALGLEHLRSLPALRRMTLDDEIRSRVGDEKIKRILPNCEVR